VTLFVTSLVTVPQAKIWANKCIL